MHTDDTTMLSVGERACLRAEQVDALGREAAVEAQVERTLAQLVAAPGAADESWQLKRLRALQERAPDVDDDDAFAAAPSSGSNLSGGMRTTTYQPGRDGLTVKTELYWRAERLIWSRSGVVMRAFTFGEPVRWACWAWFDKIDHTTDDDNEHSQPPRANLAQRALCIFLPASLIIHMPHSGNEYVKRLELEVAGVRVLERGLLVQRKLEAEDRRRLQRMCRRATDMFAEPMDEEDVENIAADVDSAPLPHLFLLRRPFDELEPVGQPPLQTASAHEWHALSEHDDEQRRSDKEYASQDRLTSDVLRCVATSIGDELKAQWLTQLAKNTSRRSDWLAVVDAVLGAAPAPASDAASTVTRSAWQTMLDCAQDTGVELYLPPLEQAQDAGGSTSGKRVDSVFDRPTSISILKALNFVAQDLRLDTQRSGQDVARISQLIVQLASKLEWTTWVDRWIRLGASIPTLETASSHETHSPATDEEEMFDVYEHLLSAMQSDKGSDLPNDALPLTRKMAHIYMCFSKQSVAFKTMSGQRSTDEEQAACKVVEAVLQQQVDEAMLNRLPFALALPILQARQTCKLNPPVRWSAKAYLCIGRRDLAMQMSRTWPRTDSTGGLSSRRSGHSIEREGSRTSRKPTLPSVCYQLFSKDHRLTDVANMLQTSRAVATKGPSEASTAQTDEDVMAEQQKRIFVSVSDRLKATSVGRAMFLLSSEPIQTAEQLKIAPICLRIRMMCHCIVQHREPDADSAEMEWPEFHNGVAAALQLATDGVQVESSWIYSQTKSEVTARHAGFVYGIGLLGQLRNLGKIHAHRYLSNRHPATTIGLLLGIALSFVGSCDVMAKALMSIHLVHTLPMHSKPLKTTMLEQSAALVGLGFVFLGSNDRWASRMALKAMGTDVVVADDHQMARRECFSLSAGFALGLVCLGQGCDTLGSAALEREVVPSIERLIKHFATENGVSVDKKIRMSDGEATASAKRAADFAAFEWRPDISLTSTPASLALALIYLRSNRKDIADKLDLPISVAQLDEVRPEILQLRLLARSLIMWDDVRPSQAWLDAVLPSFTRIQELRNPSESAQMAYWNMRTGAILAVGLKFAGSNSTKARVCLLSELESFQRNADVRPVTFFEKVRQQTLRSSIDVILTCLAMVCAGSGDVTILQIIRKTLFKIDSMRYGNYMASTMAVGMLFLGAGRYTLASTDTAVAVLLLSFYPRFPINAQDNRAHLQAYRHLWIMAVEARLLSVEDVDSGETSETPIAIHVQRQRKLADEKDDESELRLISTPCVLPQLDSVRAIYLHSDRYFAAALEVHDDAHHRKALAEGQTMFAMRHAAVLSYERDRLGRASLLEQLKDTALELTLPDESTQVLTSDNSDARQRDARALARKISTLIDRPMIATLARAMADDNDGERTLPLVRTVIQQRAQLFMVFALLDCLRHDKMEVLSGLLGLYEGVRRCLDDGDGEHAVLRRCIFAVDFAFVRQFVMHEARRVVDVVHPADHNRQTLLERSFVERMALVMDVGLEEKRARSAHVQAHLAAYAVAACAPSRAAGGEDASVANLAGVILTEHSVPSLAVLRVLRRFVDAEQQRANPARQTLVDAAQSALQLAGVSLAPDAVAIIVNAWLPGT